MGVLTTGNSAGGIVYPIVVRQLMPKVSLRTKTGPCVLLDWSPTPLPPLPPAH